MNPEELERLHQRQAALDQKVQSLLKPADGGTIDKAALRAALVEQFDARTELRQAELDRISGRVVEMRTLLERLERQQAELDRMRAEFKRRNDQRDELIDRRLNELTRPDHEANSPPRP